MDQIRFVAFRMATVMSATDTLALAAPNINLPALPQGKWQREFEAFQQLLPQLLSQYSGQYVVVHDGQVISHGPDDVALALRFFAEHGNVPIHIGLVTNQPDHVTHVPHYRELPGVRS